MFNEGRSGGGMLAHKEGGFRCGKKWTVEWGRDKGIGLSRASAERKVTPSDRNGAGGERLRDE